MNFEIKDLIYILAMVASVLVTFLGTRHKMKEYVRDKNDELRNEITDLKVKHQELKSKDDLQQLVIDQIKKQVDELIPNLVEAVKNKKRGNGK